MIHQPMALDASIFRAYDIRGIIDKQLNSDTYYLLGKTVAVFLHQRQQKRTLIARDGRLTSELFAAALSQGLIDSGIDVVHLGALPTPTLYYATHVTDIPNGLMVTGSHNPAHYNGLKIVVEQQTLVDSDIQALYQIASQPVFLSGKGQVTHQDISDDYIQAITGQIQLKKTFKIVVDAGNGIAGPLVVKCLAALGCDVVPLFCDVDGHFPNHHPDPTVPENLNHLKQEVLNTQADIGLAFDGDGDRLGVVTNHADIVWADRLLMFYAKDLLQRHPLSTIVYDVKCTRHLTKLIQEYGGTPLMCPTGHSIVKRVMKESQALLAGEMSGHLFFKERWYGFDDALYSACRLLEQLSQTIASFAEQLIMTPQSYHTPEIQIPIHEQQKFSFMSQLLAQVQSQSIFSDAELIIMDGLRAEFHDGWGLIRASNTTPSLVARFEADNPLSLSRIQNDFKIQLQAIDSNLQVPF